MPSKLGWCHSCRGSIYDVDGPGDACGCDDGILTTLTLRDGGTPTRVASSTPVPTRRPNLNGDELPDLDPNIFLDDLYRRGLISAQTLMGDLGFPAESLTLPVRTAGRVPLEVQFDTLEMDGTGGDDWPAGLARPVAPSRDRFRVDQGAPVRAPFQGRIAAGQSEGRVVGRVGEPMGRPQPNLEIGRDAPVEWIPTQASNRMTAVERQMAAQMEDAANRTVARQRSTGSRPVTTQPAPVDRSKIPTALERLGRVDFDDDPFK